MGLFDAFVEWLGEQDSSAEHPTTFRDCTRKKGCPVNQVTANMLLLRPQLESLRKAAGLESEQETGRDEELLIKGFWLNKTHGNGEGHITQPP